MKPTMLTAHGTTLFLLALAVLLAIFYAYVYRQEARHAYGLGRFPKQVLRLLRIVVALLVLVALARPALCWRSTRSGCRSWGCSWTNRPAWSYPDARDNPLVQSSPASERRRYDTAQSVVQKLQEKLTRTHRVQVFTFSDTTKLLRELAPRTEGVNPVWPPRVVPGRARSDRRVHEHQRRLAGLASGTLGQSHLGPGALDRRAPDRRAGPGGGRGAGRRRQGAGAYGGPRQRVPLARPADRRRGRGARGQPGRRAELPREDHQPDPAVAGHPAHAFRAGPEGQREAPGAAPRREPGLDCNHRQYGRPARVPPDAAKVRRRSGHREQRVHDRREGGQADAARALDRRQRGPRVLLPGAGPVARSGRGSVVLPAIERHRLRPAGQGFHRTASPRAGRVEEVRRGAPVRRGPEQDHQPAGGRDGEHGAHRAAG